MTLTELADRVGLTLAHLSILETGKARHPLHDAGHVLRRAAMPAGYLLSFEP
jgi:hypothetical protein